MSYNARKAAQTIAFLALKNKGNALDVLKAIKLIYLADRESLKQYGFPILEENRYSLPHGPVNSETYSYIQGERDDTQVGWSEFLPDREDHKVGLANDGLHEDDLDELSDADINILNKVWSEFGTMDKWQLVEWTHDPLHIPEWEDPGQSSQLIPLKRILGFLNAEHALDQEELIRNMDRLDRAFKSHS